MIIQMKRSILLMRSMHDDWLPGIISNHVEGSTEDGAATTESIAPGNHRVLLRLTVGFSFELMPRLMKWNINGKRGGSEEDLSESSKSILIEQIAIFSLNWLIKQSFKTTGDSCLCNSMLVGFFQFPTIYPPKLNIMKNDNSWMDSLRTSFDTGNEMMNGNNTRQNNNNKKGKHHYHFPRPHTHTYTHAQTPHPAPHTPRPEITSSSLLLILSLLTSVLFRCLAKRPEAVELFE